MDRIISIVFAFFAMMFTAAAAQAKPGLPSDSELLAVDCGAGGKNCPVSDGGTIQSVIDERGLSTTPEKVALLTNTRTGECPNLTSGSIWMICALSNGSKMWVDPLDYQLRTAASVRALDVKLGCRRVEFGLNRRHGARLVVFQQLPPCQRGREACEDHVDGLERQVRDLQAGRPPAQSALGQSPPYDDELSALQAALNQESRALTNLRHAIADCDGKVQLNDSGALVCAAVSGGVSTAAPGVGKFFTNTEAVGAIVALLALWGLVLGLRKWRHVRDVLDDTRKSLHLAQDTHSALRTLYDALRVQVDRAKELLHAGDQATMDDVADATRRGVFVALGVDYREVPRDADIVQAVSDKVATLKDRYHELASQIRRARGALRVADDADLARAAQSRMDEIDALRGEKDRLNGRLLEANSERAALISKVGEALGELGAHEADVSEIAMHARKVADTIDNLRAQLAEVRSERDVEHSARHQAGVRIEAMERDLAEMSAHAGSILDGLHISEPASRDGEALERLCGQVDALHQYAAQTRAEAEVQRQLASLTQAELSGLRGRVNGFAAVTEVITSTLSGAEYFHEHPYARPRRKQGGQMVESPQREQFGRLIATLRGVFPAPPPSPKPERPRRSRRGKQADISPAAASA